MRLAPVWRVPLCAYQFTALPPGTRWLLACQAAEDNLAQADSPVTSSPPGHYRIVVTAALEQTIVRNPGHPIEGFRDVRLEIETEEPPVCRGLDTLCYNELLTAQGKSRSDNSNGSAPYPHMSV